MESPSLLVEGLEGAGRGRVFLEVVGNLEAIPGDT